MDSTNIGSILGLTIENEPGMSGSHKEKLLYAIGKACADYENATGEIISSYVKFQDDKRYCWAGMMQAVKYCCQAEQDLSEKTVT